MKNFINLIYTVLCVVAFNANIASAEDDHSHSPHDGIVTPFTDRDRFTGELELKLHDDKGDLELWLTGIDENTPFDIPLNSEIKVTFLDMGGKEVWLRARNNVDNEDEDGKANIRSGKTNYFIFPGNTSESADFLVGKDFSSTVEVSFIADGKLFNTDAFVLMPHTH